MHEHRFGSVANIKSLIQFALSSGCAGDWYLAEDKGIISIVW